jgi:hypothetical protein
MESVASHINKGSTYPTRMESVVNIWLLLSGLKSWGLNDLQASQMLQVSLPILLTWKEDRENKPDVCVSVPEALCEERLKAINHAMLITSSAIINKKGLKELSLSMGGNSSPAYFIRNVKFENMTLLECFMKGDVTQSKKASEFISKLFDY